MIVEQGKTGASFKIVFGDILLVRTLRILPISQQPFA
jgi:hypothetical protein